MNEIQKYIADARARGASDEQIRENLLQSGWDEPTINTFISSPQQNQGTAAEVKSPQSGAHFIKPEQANVNRKLVLKAGLMVLFGIIAVVVVLVFFRPSDEGALIDFPSEDSSQEGLTYDSPSLSLSQSRRETQRRNHLGVLVATLEQYASDNSGSYPPFSDIESAAEEYIDDYDSFVDPSSKVNYEFIATQPNVGQIQYVIGFACTDENELISRGGTRAIALRTKLETGELYCVDNGG